MSESNSRANSVNVSARKSVRIDLTEDSRQDLKSFPTLRRDFPDVFRDRRVRRRREHFKLGPCVRPNPGLVDPIYGMFEPVNLRNQLEAPLMFLMLVPLQLILLHDRESLGLTADYTRKGSGGGYRRIWRCVVRQPALFAPADDLITAAAAYR